MLWVHRIYIAVQLWCGVMIHGSSFCHTKYQHSHSSLILPTMKDIQLSAFGMCARAVKTAK